MTKCMKRHILMYSLLATGLLMTSCSEISVKESCTPDAQNTVQTDANGYLTRTFAQPDGSKVLNGTPSQNLKALFEAVGPEVITSLGMMKITDAEYQEIKTFTDNLVAGKTSQKEQYQTIFNWVVKNLKYDYGYSNDPYEVFVNKICVCQGYSNLLTVMCYSQGIPTVVVNGFLYTPNYGGLDLGHAWAYSCPDGVWTVSDPTNGGSWNMSDVSSYTHLKPQQMEFELYRDDDIVCEYSDFNLNIKEIRQGTGAYSLPYSAMGFVIGSFNPTVELPKDITEIYVGQNITTLGETDKIMGLLTHGGNLQAMYVDEENPVLSSHKGVVYKKNDGNPQLYYIPGGMSFVELLPMETVEKNTIYNHMNVQEIYFTEGTKRLESWAVENCPKLERVYLPEGTEVSSNALPKGVEIIYGIPSGIKHVTM